MLEQIAEARRLCLADIENGNKMQKCRDLLPPYGEISLGVLQHIRLAFGSTTSIAWGAQHSMVMEAMTMAPEGKRAWTKQETERFLKRAMKSQEVWEELEEDALLIW